MRKLLCHSVKTQIYGQFIVRVRPCDLVDRPFTRKKKRSTKSHELPATKSSCKSRLLIRSLMPVLCVLSVAAQVVAQPPLKSSANNPLIRSSAIRENFIRIEKRNVRYIELGSGPTVVMIHGNAGSVEDFEFGAAEVLASHYRVVAVDRPGHGRSERLKDNGANVENQARLLHEVLTSLQITRPVLIGHSWGAALALSYALQYPADISGLVLIAPAAYPDSGESSFIRAVTKAPVVGDLALVAGKTLLGKHILSVMLQRAFYPQPVPRAYVTLAAASWLGRKQLKAYLEDESSLNDSLETISKRYSQISAPVVIVTGDRDQIVSAKDNAYRLEAAITNARVITLKDTGHEIPQTHPESIYEALSLITSPTKLTDVSSEQVITGGATESSRSCLMRCFGYSTCQVRNSQ
jgi:pimeloyl-ACP methyl ester carboxylesterase